MLHRYNFSIKTTHISMLLLVDDSEPAACQFVQRP